VLYTICNPCGPVQRIVIFRKNGVQAMVEYPSGLPAAWGGFGAGGEGAESGAVGPVLPILCPPRPFRFRERP